MTRCDKNCPSLKKEEIAPRGAISRPGEALLLYGASDSGWRVAPIRGPRDQGRQTSGEAPLTPPVFFEARTGVFPGGMTRLGKAAGNGSHRRQHLRAIGPLPGGKSLPKPTTSTSESCTRRWIAFYSPPPVLGRSTSSDRYQQGAKRCVHAYAVLVQHANEPVLISGD